MAGQHGEGCQNGPKNDKGMIHDIYVQGLIYDIYDKGINYDI